MSQCIFYSLFIAFPKSRHIFNSEFKNKLIKLFGYIYNGLNVDKFGIDHWDLDLGSGNILTNEDDLLNEKEKKSSKIY